MLVAARGAGCWWNGARCRVSPIAALPEATVLTTDERFAADGGQLAGWRNLSGKAAIARSWGDCYGYLLVATGRAEVMVDGIVSPWDAAALMPIVEEAGGVFTDWKGTRTAFGGSAVATNQGVAVESRLLLDTGITRDVHA
jgi:histidinol-phosphatase